MSPTPSYSIRLVQRDGKAVVKFQCPGCGKWGVIDDDQYHGRVSIACLFPECDFHETLDLATLCSEGGSA
jgi:hypothetical protein